MAAGSKRSGDSSAESRHAKTVRVDAAGSAETRQHGTRRRSKSAVLDLDDLHPHLMYGALMSSLRSLLRSFYDIVPAVLSPRVVAVGLLLAVPFVVFESLLQVAAVLFVVAESCFFFWMRVVRWRLNALTPLSQRLCPTNPQDIFRRTCEQVDQCETWSVGRSSKEWLEGWFLKTPLSQIKRGNVEEFFAWAAFNKFPEELNDSQLSEMGSMLQECENRYNWGLEAGYTQGVKSMRINFEPIKAWCHPLWYYASILGLQVAARSTMQLFGFTYHKRGGRLAYFHRPLPPPPGLLVLGGEPASPARALPVVLVHGLGVGIAPYLRFIRRLATVREIFVLELPEISQSCSTTVPPPEAVADSLAAMLHAHGHQQACFVAHSYGTFVMSWVLEFRRDIVAKVVLLDPVCFMLAQPDVAYNFLYRQPDNPILMVVCHFVRWELFTAHVLMRHFYWHHNVLWRQDLPRDSVVVLSSHDDICNAHHVRRYLEDHQREQGAHGSSLKLIWLDGFFHGGILLSRPAQLQVMEFL